MVFSPMPGVPVLPEGLRGGPQRGPQRFRGGRLLRASAARPGRVPASVRIAPNRIVTIVHCQQDKLFALQSCRFFLGTDCSIQNSCCELVACQRNQASGTAFFLAPEGHRVSLALLQGPIRRCAMFSISSVGMRLIWHMAHGKSG